MEELSLDDLLVLAHWGFECFMQSSKEGNLILKHGGSLYGIE